MEREEVLVEAVKTLFLHTFQGALAVHPVTLQVVQPELLVEH